MKVYEIIAENKEIDEARLPPKATGAIASAGTTLASKAGNWLGKIFNSERSQLVKAIADNLGSSKWAGKATAKHASRAAQGLGAKAVSMAKADKSILDDAAKLANKSRGYSMFGKVGDNIGTAAGVAGKVGAGALKLAPWGVRLYTSWQIYDLFKNYSDNVDAWDKKLQADVAAGKLSEEDYKKQIAGVRQTELGLLVPKVAAGIVGMTMTTAFFGGLGKVFRWSDNAAVKGLGHVISGLGTAGNAYMWSKINSPEGSNAVATLLTGTALGDWATGIMGQTAAGAIDWFRGTAKDAAEADAGKKPTTTGQGGSDTPVKKPGAKDDEVKAPSEVRYTAPTQPATAASKEYAPPGYTRDAQGNLIHTGD